MDTKQTLIQLYQNIRQQTEKLCKPLVVEDYVIQSIEDVSPPKWHLAHTTWFFETFILLPQLDSYQPFDSLFQYLFNSYYQTLGTPYPRIRRGALSRPTVEAVYHYRHYVDERMLDYLHALPETLLPMLKATLLLGLHHEQQHQELLLMDVKHNFSLDPSFPVYHPRAIQSHSATLASRDWLYYEGGIVDIGYHENEFCFDNELPHHQIILKPYLLAPTLVTNGEYLEFIEAGGYTHPEYWLSDGWDCVQRNHWHAPLYWQKQDNKWHLFTLSGLREINVNEPVVHISYYEADAFARWRGLCLPTESEWEHAVISQRIHPVQGNFLEEEKLHPCSIIENNTQDFNQLFGDVWEWTASAYTPYPGYKPLSGALGEYNGKFMSNQMVLRGGCCVTPRSHIRASYRNFFQPDKRWQFSGIRLANHV